MSSNSRRFLKPLLKTFQTAGSSLHIGHDSRCSYSSFFEPSRFFNYRGSNVKRLLLNLFFDSLGLLERFASAPFRSHIDLGGRSLAFLLSSLLLPFRSRTFVSHPFIAPQSASSRRKQMQNCRVNFRYRPDGGKISS